MIVKNEINTDITHTFPEIIKIISKEKQEIITFSISSADIVFILSCKHHCYKNIISGIKILLTNCRKEQIPLNFDYSTKSKTVNLRENLHIKNTSEQNQMLAFINFLLMFSKKENLSAKLLISEILKLFSPITKTNHIKCRLLVLDTILNQNHYIFSYIFAEALYVLLENTASNSTINILSYIENNIFTVEFQQHTNTLMNPKLLQKELKNRIKSHYSLEFGDKNEMSLKLPFICGNTHS